jgi:hypothetical protein
MKKPRKNDYMKYWRVIRFFVKKKYKINTEELDMLFFLYSEDYFTSTKFQEFNNILPWKRHRFYKLKKEGWIEVIEPYRYGGPRSLYTLSFKAVRMIDSIYKKLNGSEFPTTQTINPMFAKRVGFSAKVHRNMMIKINEAIKQQQYHSLEL